MRVREDVTATGIDQVLLVRRWKITIQLLPGIDIDIDLDLGWRPCSSTDPVLAV